MFHGLSRRTLNALIIGCLLIITYLNLSTTPDEDTPLEPLTLAPLPETGWHLWYSREGVPVYWQSNAEDSLRIAVQGDEDVSFKTRVNGQDWATALKARLMNSDSDFAAGIALQGPLSETELKQAASYLISTLQLTPPPTRMSECRQQHPAGALWWNREQGKSTVSDVDLPASVLSTGDAQAAIQPAMQSQGLPDRDAWQAFRSGEAKRLRREWLSPAAIDIAADLAYHRWPENDLKHLYQTLATAQRDAPHAFALCQRAATNSVTRSSE